MKYIEVLEEEDCGCAFPMGNWYVHDMVASTQEVSSYFSGNLSEESRLLWEEFARLINTCEKSAYLADITVQQKRFPWFANFDLDENLRKKLSIEQLATHDDKSTYLPDWIFGRIIGAALLGVVSQIKSTNLYRRKKILKKE